MPLTTKDGVLICPLPGGRDIRLYRRDCIHGMYHLIAPKSVDVVVTSPPYNLGVDYSGDYDDRMSRKEYLNWMGIWAARVERVLSDGGSLFLNVGSKPSDPYVPFDLLEVMREYFQLQNVIHWVKSIAIMKREVGNYPGITGDIVVGHYKPINSARFLNDCHEFVFHLTKNGGVPIDRLAIGVPYQDKSNVKRWKGAHSGVHCRGNTWFIPYQTIQSRDKERPHPATFPAELPRRCITLHGRERTNLVLDPFLGIGTTALVCKEMGISCVGFELSQDYFEQTCRAMGSFPNQLGFGEEDQTWFQRPRKRRSSSSSRKPS